jgi:hypothetical protein
VSVDTLGPRPTFVLAGAAALLSLAAIAAGSKRARRTARHR